MSAHEKTDAAGLAMAFLRKGGTSSRFIPRAQHIEETDDHWIFDFYHTRWREFRGNQPHGVRISVNKETGKAEHHATLVVEKPGSARTRIQLRRGDDR